MAKSTRPPEVAQAFEDPHWSQRFPPLLTVDEAEELVNVPKATIYDWSSRGLLSDCAFRVGKYLRIWRDSFLKLISEGGISGSN